MKVTIDVPAPSYLLELNSRLKQKNRNYKTQLRQLSRAHFITKRLLQDTAAIHIKVAEQAKEIVRLREQLKPVPSPSPEEVIFTGKNGWFPRPLVKVGPY